MLAVIAAILIVLVIAVIVSALFVAIILEFTVGDENPSQPRGAVPAEHLADQSVDEHDHEHDERNPKEPSQSVDG